MTSRTINFFLASAMLAACSPSPASQTAPASTEAAARPRLTEEEVRQDLVGEGYRDVINLQAQPDGSWTATAMLNGQPRQVMVTPNGFVFPR